MRCMIEHRPVTVGGGVELALGNKEGSKRVEVGWFLGLGNRTCRTGWGKHKVMRVSYEI